MGLGLVADQPFRPICIVEERAYAVATLIKNMESGYLSEVPVWDQIETFNSIPWSQQVDFIIGTFVDRGLEDTTLLESVAGIFKQLQPERALDGIGIYPGQEHNLTETDVYLQYEEFARELDRLPDHMTAVILPGNHDAVRPAEPQPVLESLVQKKFSSAIHVGNPSRIGLSGIEVLAYFLCEVVIL